MEKDAWGIIRKRFAPRSVHTSIRVPLPDTLLQQLQKFTRSDAERLGLNELKNIRKQMLDGDKEIPQVIEKGFWNFASTVGLEFEQLHGKRLPSSDPL